MKEIKHDDALDTILPHEQGCRYTLFTFYAHDRQHAELKAEEILDLYGYERVDLKEYSGRSRMALAMLL